MPVVLLRRINAWINRRTVDQGGLVPLVHVALAALDWPSLPSSLPSRVAAVIDGEGRCANWTSHSYWRRAVVRSFKAIHLCIHERRGLSDVATSGHTFVAAKVLAGPSDQGHFPDDFLMAAYDHVRSSPFLADILTSWVLIMGVHIIHRSTDFYTVTKI